MNQFFRKKNKENEAKVAEFLRGLQLLEEKYQLFLQPTIASEGPKFVVRDKKEMDEKRRQLEGDNKIIIESNK